MLPHPCHFTPSSTAMHPAQDCFASRHAAAACHSAASPEPRVITTHKQQNWHVLDKMGQLFTFFVTPHFTQKKKKNRNHPGKDKSLSGFLI
jgi:hypothetical protein